MYNVEMFIENCLNSILSQKEVSEADFEVIIVDDGSRDNSLLLAQKYALFISNFTIIRQPNQGLSSARNVGLLKAKGDYVWFIDSDDWIANDSLEKIFGLIDKEQPDVIHFRAINSFGGKLIDRIKPFTNTDIIYSGSDILKDGLWSTCVPFYILRRHFLSENNLNFCLGIFHEDNEFTPRMLFYAKKVCLLNDILYYVYQNPNSITRTINFKKSFDLIIVARNLYSFCVNQVRDNKIRRVFYRFISLNINNALHGSKEMKNDMIFNLEKELKMNSILLNCLIYSRIPKYIIEGCLFKLFSRYVSIYKLIRIFKF